MRNNLFSRDHAKGMLLGIVTPLVIVPLVILIISLFQNYDFSYLWKKFTLNNQFQIRIITLSLIANLIWFYIFLNREKWNIGRGVIYGTLAFAPYIIYVKFF